MAATYDKTALNTGNRLRNRVHYDKDLIHGIIDETPILHVAFNPADPSTEPFPAVLPMLGCIGSFPGGQTDPEETIYLHGYVSARLMKYPSPSTSSEDGSPVTISASILDGLVLSLTPFHNSCNYRSAVVFGYASIVSDETEKLWALKLITENIIKGRWEGSRVPPNKTEMTSTGVLKVRIQSASAKVRTGGPSEDRKDLKDVELRERTWTGVVPAWLHWGTPIPAGGEGGNRAKEVPRYIEDWVREENEKGEVGAKKAVEKE
ncbi:hypothetical protein V8F33_007612 [Rhypophila sp. PSN 637]